MDDPIVCTTNIVHQWAWQGQSQDTSTGVLIALYACIWCGMTKEEEIHVNV